MLLAEDSQSRTLASPSMETVDNVLRSPHADDRASPTNTSGSDGSAIAPLDIKAILAASQGPKDVSPSSSPPVKRLTNYSTLPAAHNNSTEHVELRKMTPTQSMEAASIQGPLFGMPDPSTIYHFLHAQHTLQQMQMQQAARVQQHIQQQSQQQAQQQERKRSYPCTFQFCVICQKDVHSSKLPCHIRQCHVAKPMFQCPACDFTSTYSKNNVKSHMVSLHGLAGDPISYMDKYAPQVEEFMKMCFPNVRGRGRPMQNRSGSNSASRTTTTPPRAVQPAHLQTPVTRRMQTPAPAQPVFNRGPIRPQDFLALHQQHALLAAAQGLNPLTSIFPQALNNNNNNNSIAFTKTPTSNTANMPEQSPRQPSQQAAEGGSGDGTENVVVSSSASSLDDIISAMQNTTPATNANRSMSLASVRMITQPIRPGDNLQPRYVLPGVDWSVLNEDQARSTVFNIITEVDHHLENSAFVVPIALGAADPLLTEEQAAAVAAVREQLLSPTYEILFAISKMNLSIVPLETVELVMTIAPSAVDAQRIREYCNAFSRQLNEDEHFVVGLAQINRLEEKLAIMRHMGRFNREVESVQERLRRLQLASKLLLDSEAFRRLLGLVLAVENLLVGGQAQPIRAFMVSKMSEICSYVLPSGESILSCLAKTIKGYHPDVLPVFDLIDTLNNAAECSFVDIVNSINTVELANTRAEYEQRESSSGSNAIVAEFLDHSRIPFDTMFEQALNTKEDLCSLLGFMGEPIPHITESFAPEVFFSKIGSFLISLREAMSEDAVPIDVQGVDDTVDAAVEMSDDL